MEIFQSDFLVLFNFIFIHPEAGNPALKGGVFSKNGWGGVRSPSPTKTIPGLKAWVHLEMGCEEEEQSILREVFLVDDYEKDALNERLKKCESRAFSTEVSLLFHRLSHGYF